LEQPRRTGPRPLVPAAMRSLTVAILVSCAAVTAVLGVLVAGQTRAGPLDRWVDARVRSGLGGQWRGLEDLAGVGDVMPVVVMTAVLVLACLVTRRWRGAVLAAVAVPAAAGLTELVLKPLVGRTLMGALSFPSGTETRVFSVAAVFAVLMADPVRPRIPAAVRLALAVAVLLAATAVAVALVALDQHYFTDTVAGAAVGTAVALVTALILDRLGPHSGQT
jgi:membrane-associated phospholipid phosphatase